MRADEGKAATGDENSREILLFFTVKGGGYYAIKRVLRNSNLVEKYAYGKTSAILFLMK